MLKRWERYFIGQFLTFFFFFLGCFYSLYVLIDYASHTSALPQNTTQIGWNDLIRYYLYIFASRSEILLPLALLIALIKTVTTLNSNHELVALMAGGISLKRLMRPFIVFSLAIVVLLYINEQFILPQALMKLRQIETHTKQKKQRASDGIAVHSLILENGTRLLFQSYDPIQANFFDVYWIESIDSIYRIKTLSHAAIPVGHFVDHLVRQSTGELFQQTAYPTFLFPTIKFNREILQSTIFEPDMHSLTELADHYVKISPDLNERESKLLTAFYWKVLSPWLALLAIILPIPFCVRFSRQLPIFFIYVCCLFGLIGFYMLMDASQVIAKRQVLTPLYAIGFPFSLVFSFFGWRYLTLK
jgi:lipopolysaccharide export system permease protein